MVVALTTLFCSFMKSVCVSCAIVSPNNTEVNFILLAEAEFHGNTPVARGSLLRYLYHSYTGELKVTVGHRTCVISG